ncbi:MAG: hypothetical protein IJB96_06275 [Lachnospira sp.]|nr:hypothetical protein [Lachnospira sp.]
MGLFNSKSKQIKKEMDNLFNDIQINLENNYKDLAIGARKKAEERLEELKQSNQLSDRDYTKFKQKLDVFTERMKGYHH